MAGTRNRIPRTRFTLAVLLVTTVTSLSGGCGSEEPETVMDASILLERYERDRRRHDPICFSEVDLGDFNVTQDREQSIFFIRFHLHAVVPDGLVEQFDELFQTHNKRVRAKVREIAQSCDIDQLNDPSLGWLKSELITSINRVVQVPIIRDVVFSDFSFERG